MRSLALLIPAALAASCTAPSPQEIAAAQSREIVDLQRALNGAVPAGPRVACLPSSRTDGQINVSDNIILFRYGGTYYRNDPPGGCNGLGRGNNALVTRSIGASLCRGDIATVADLSTGTTVGSCVLGDFVPYRRPGR